MCVLELGADDFAKLGEEGVKERQIKREREREREVGEEGR